MTSKLPGKNRQSVSGRIIQDLENRIANKEWLPGAKLPSIRQLSQDYGVAPLTMNRVIRQLAAVNLVTSLPSKGVYVAAADNTVAKDQTVDTSWQLGLLRRQPPRSFSVKLPQIIPANPINLATGTMSNLAIPIETLRQAIRRTSHSYAESPIWQRSPQGEVPLRKWFAADQVRQGISSSLESTLIVSSTHQAFRIIAATIVEPGDVVLIEAPSDPIVMGVFELAGARCIGVPVDADGMVVQQARELAARFQPKAIVTCPSGQIPTGVTMSVERRRQLVEIGTSFRTLIIEYDNGNEVFFDAPPPKPVKSWDTAGTVAFVQDISRITMAGFRVGCLTLEGPLLPRLVDSKRRDDLLTSTLSQYALLNYVDGPDYAPNLIRLRSFYKERRDAALAALTATMPSSASWYTPNVGFHIWVKLPPGVSARGLTQEAAARGVIVAPSEIFSLDDNLDSEIRITFADNPPPMITEGISRIGKTLETMMATARSPEPTRIFEVV